MAIPAWTEVSCTIGNEQYKNLDSTKLTLQIFSENKSIELNKGIYVFSGVYEVMTIQDARKRERYHNGYKTVCEDENDFCFFNIETDACVLLKPVSF